MTLLFDVQDATERPIASEVPDDSWVGAFRDCSVADEELRMEVEDPQGLRHAMTQKMAQEVIRRCEKRTHDGDEDDSDEDAPPTVTEFNEEDRRHWTVFVQCQQKQVHALEGAVVWMTLTQRRMTEMLRMARALMKDAVSSRS